MRTRTWIVLSLGVLFFTCTHLKADEVDEALTKMDEVIAQLEAYKASLDQNYFEMIKSHLQYTSTRYYSFKTYDYFGVVLGTLAHAEVDRLRLQELQDEISDYQKEISDHPSKAQLNWSNLFFAQLEIDNLLRRLQFYQGDLKALKQGWEQRCQGERLQEEISYFDPKKHFNPEGRFAALVSPAGGFSVGVSVSMGSNGTVNGASVYAGNGGEQEEWEPGADTTAAVLSSYCGLWAPACFAGYYVLKLMVTYDSREDHLANKEERQYRLISQIRSIQLKAIDQLAEEEPEMILNICTSSLQVEPQWSFQDISNLESEIVRTKVQLEIYMRDTLGLAQAELSQFINEIYIPEVESVYLANLESYYDNKKAINAKAREFLTPIATKISARPLPDASISKILYQHRVWEKVIEGDSQFFELDRNTSLEALGSSTFENRWEAYGQALLKTVAK